MKKLLALSLLTGTLLLGACGNNDVNDQDNVSNPPENAPVENGNDNDTVNNPGSNDGTKNNNKADTAAVPFISFDLDVDYDNFKSFEVEYDNETEGMEAKIEDELNNRTLRGDEAFAELRSRFEAYKFDQNTAPEEVINEVIKSFDLKDNYQKIDLEIKFADGTEKEYLK